MGAWMETYYSKLIWKDLIVAPYMGAWMETKYVAAEIVRIYSSHPVWVRGWKQHGKEASTKSKCRTHIGCDNQNDKEEKCSNDQKIFP